MSFKTDRHLLEAIEQCHSTKLVHSIKVGQHIHVQNELGQNLLVHLLQQQYLEEDSLMNKKRFRIFRSLVVLGNLDIHTADHYGKNLFNWATHLNCTQEALFLLRTYPGDVDILKRDHAGSSSLHYAVEHGNDLLVRAISGYLLRYRLRFDVKDALNYTPEDLARKLNYTSIADFLAKSCRSTIYLSRETPAQQSTRPMSGNSKIATSTASPPIVDPFESFHLMETRITKAKHSGDWKTVAALRAFKIHSDPKNTLRLHNYLTQLQQKESLVPASTKLPPIVHRSPKASQSGQMLYLLESQMSPSFRLPFTPVYNRLLQLPVGFPLGMNAQRKLSQASSRRISSVSSHRKRDSEISQISIATIQDNGNRMSLPAVLKPHRQPTVTTC